MVAELTCGVLAPTRTPEPIVAQISDATAAVMKQPDFELVLQAAGLETRSDASPVGAQAFLASERQRLIPIIKAAGLQPQ
jgi:tripartite-type tricarboxylate transporter receptor subunit TctC